MSIIFDRLGALGATEFGKAADFAHETFRDRMSEHRHSGRALVETVAELCRNHPNLVGLGAGLLVEQLLVHERDRHAARMTAKVDAPAAGTLPAAPFGPLD